MNALTIVDLDQADELSHSSMVDVVGGTRAQAVLEAILYLQKSDYDAIEVESVPYVSMKL